MGLMFWAHLHQLRERLARGEGRQALISAPGRWLVSFSIRSVCNSVLTIPQVDKGSLRLVAVAFDCRLNRMPERRTMARTATWIAFPKEALSIGNMIEDLETLT